MVIPPKFTLVRDFKEGMAAAFVDKKWTFINKTGATVFTLEDDVDRVDDFSEGIAVAWKYSQERGAYIRRDGTHLTDFRFSEANDFKDGIAWAVSDSPPFKGYIYKTGKPVWQNGPKLGGAQS